MELSAVRTRLEVVKRVLEIAPRHSGDDGRFAQNADNGIAFDHEKQRQSRTCRLPQEKPSLDGDLWMTRT